MNRLYGDNSDAQTARHFFLRLLFVKTVDVSQ